MLLTSNNWINTKFLLLTILVGVSFSLLTPTLLAQPYDSEESDSLYYIDLNSDRLDGVYTVNNSTRNFSVTLIWSGDLGFDNNFNSNVCKLDFAGETYSVPKSGSKSFTLTAPSSYPYDSTKTASINCQTIDGPSSEVSDSKVIYGLRDPSSDFDSDNPVKDPRWWDTVDTDEQDTYFIAPTYPADDNKGSTTPMTIRKSSYADSCNLYKETIWRHQPPTGGESVRDRTYSLIKEVLGTETVTLNTDTKLWESVNVGYSNYTKPYQVTGLGPHLRYQLVCTRSKFGKTLTKTQWLEVIKMPPELEITNFGTQATMNNGGVWTVSTEINFIKPFIYHRFYLYRDGENDGFNGNEKYVSQTNGSRLIDPDAPSGNTVDYYIIGGYLGADEVNYGGRNIKPVKTFDKITIDIPHPNDYQEGRIEPLRGDGQVSINIEEATNWPGSDVFDHYILWRSTDQGNWRDERIGVFPRTVEMRAGAGDVIIDDKWSSSDINAGYWYTLVGTQAKYDDQGNIYDYWDVAELGQGQLVSTTSQQCDTIFNVVMDSIDPIGSNAKGGFGVSATDSDGVSHQAIYKTGNDDLHYQFTIPYTDLTSTDVDFTLDFNLPSNYHLNNIVGANGNQINLTKCSEAKPSFKANLRADVRHQYLVNQGSAVAGRPAAEINLEYQPHPNTPSGNGGLTWSQKDYQSVSASAEFMANQEQYNSDLVVKNFYGEYRLVDTNIESLSAIVYDSDGSIRNSYDTYPAFVRAMPGDTVIWEVVSDPGASDSETITGEIWANFRLCDNVGDNCIEEYIDEYLSISNSKSELARIEGSLNEVRSGSLNLNPNETITITASNKLGKFHNLSATGIPSTTSQSITCDTNAIVNDSKCKEEGFGIVPRTIDKLWKKLTGKSDESTGVILAQMTAAELFANGGFITVTPEYRAGDPDYSIHLENTSKKITKYGQSGRVCYQTKIFPANNMTATVALAGSIVSNAQYADDFTVLGQNVTSGTYNDNNTNDYEGNVCFEINDSVPNGTYQIKATGTAIFDQNGNGSSQVVNRFSQARNIIVDIPADPSGMIEVYNLDKESWDDGGTNSYVSYLSPDNSSTPLVRLRVTNLENCQDNTIEYRRNNSNQGSSNDLVNNYVYNGRQTLNNNGMSEEVWSAYCDGSFLDDIEVSINLDPVATISARTDDTSYNSNDRTIETEGTVVYLQTTNVKGCNPDSLQYYSGLTGYDEVDDGLRSNNYQITDNIQKGPTYTYRVSGCGKSNLDSITLTFTDIPPDIQVQVYDELDGWVFSSPTNARNRNSKISLRALNVPNNGSCDLVRYQNDAGSMVGSSNTRGNDFQVDGIDHSFNQTISYTAYCEDDPSNTDDIAVTNVEYGYSPSWSPTVLNFKALGETLNSEVFVFPQNGYQEVLFLASQVPPGFTVDYCNGQYYRPNEYYADPIVSKSYCFTLTDIDLAPSSGSCVSTIMQISEENSVNSTLRTIELCNEVDTDPSGTLQALHPNNGYQSGTVEYEGDSKKVDLTTAGVQNCDTNLYYKRQIDDSVQENRPVNSPNAEVSIIEFNQAYTFTVQCGSDGDVFSSIDVTVNELQDFEIGFVDNPNITFNSVGQVIDLEVWASGTSGNFNEQITLSLDLGSNDDHVSVSPNNFKLSPQPDETLRRTFTLQLDDYNAVDGATFSLNGFAVTADPETRSGSIAINLDEVEYNITTKAISKDSVFGNESVSMDWQSLNTVGDNSKSSTVNNNNSDIVGLSVDPASVDNTEYRLSNLSYPNNYYFDSIVINDNGKGDCPAAVFNNESISYSHDEKCDLGATIYLEEKPNFTIEFDDEILVIEGTTGEKCTQATIKSGNSNTDGFVTVDYGFINSEGNSDHDRIRISDVFNGSIRIAPDVSPSEEVCFTVDERVGRGSYVYEFIASGSFTDSKGVTHELEENAIGHLQIRNVSGGELTEN